jgi:hypothetical protein
LSGFAAVAVLLVGCDIGGPNEDENLNFDAAVVAADGAIEDLHMMHGPGLSLRGIVFPGLLGNRPDCPKTQDVFLCDPVEREGITYTRTITYLDASGAPQDAYDEATTASIHYEISVEGDRDRGPWSATIARERDLTVTGLLDGTGLVTWNGTGTADIDKSRHFDDGGDRTYDVVSSSEINDVVIPYPRADDSWPVSGTITRWMTLTRTSDDSAETTDRVVSIEFNGTQVVPVTVNGETFTIDLTERRFGPGKMGRHGGK